MRGRRLKARVYGNEEVKRIIAFIPPGHYHVRLILELADKTIILQEATVAAIVRAYASTALHPTKRATELVHRVLSPRDKKQGFASHQLVESSRREDEILEEATRILEEAERG
ncbi:MAG: hypothetical protein ABWW69_02450 [Pyrodictiaceae archaeon]